MSNKVDFKEFENLIEEYKKTGSTEITLKTQVVSDLIKKICEDDRKIQKLIADKYTLIIKLKQATGKDFEEIGKFLEGENKC